MKEMPGEEFWISMHCSAFCLVRERKSRLEQRGELPERGEAPAALGQHYSLESPRGSQIMLMDLPAFEPAQLWQEMLGT